MNSEENLVWEINLSHLWFQFTSVFVKGVGGTLSPQSRRGGVCEFTLMYILLELLEQIKELLN